MEITIRKLAGGKTVYQVLDERGGFLELSKKDWERILRMIRLLDKRKSTFDEITFEGGD